jgi:hypothetical protein
MTMFGGYVSPLEPVIGPAKADPLAGTTSVSGTRARHSQIVMAGLDPAIHLFEKVMDHRVKPGDDDCGGCASVRHFEFPIRFSNSMRVWGLSHSRQRKTCVIAPAHRAR